MSKILLTKLYCFFIMAVLRITTMELSWSCVFFFFQAEDGIRDVAVTGVQTCALPILEGRLAARHDRVEVQVGAAPPAGVPGRLADREDQAGEVLRRHHMRVAGPAVRQIGRASCRERVEMTVVAGSEKSTEEEREDSSV